MIRSYQDSDLNELIAAWESASELAHPFLSDTFQAQVRKDIPALYLPNADTWVVVADNHVVGFIALIGNKIGAIFLQPAYHGKKLGKLMMDKAKELHASVEVEVFEKNSIGRNFYSQCGFELIEQKFHRPTGEQVLRLKCATE